MGRPRRKRFIKAQPQTTYFKPTGIRLKTLTEVVLSFDEFEAIRLKDLLRYNQDDAAKQMGISQPTFHRLINIARKKMADAIVNGKAIKIAEGNHTIKELDYHNSTIAIATASNDLNDTIQCCFGKCKYFIIVTIANGEIASTEILENANNTSPCKAGLITAQMLVDKNIDVVITREIGLKPLTLLKQHQVHIYYANNTIKSVIQNYIDGSLENVDITTE